MKKLLTVLVATTLLAGCASSGGQNSMASNNNERFLELSENNARLIELYKERLRSAEDVTTRLKLAHAYLDAGDNESSLFTLAPLIREGKGGGEAFYLQGLAQYNVGRLRQAETSLQIAINQDAKSAKAVNMLGVVYAELGNLVGARQQFNQAREMMYDDLVIKNNLALVDMLEGKYQDAVVLLMPVYLNNPDQADPQLKANLAILLSKLGSFETLRRIYGERYSDAQLFDIFNDLKSSVPVSRDYQPIAITPQQPKLEVSPSSETSSLSI
ncbi:Tetratricopeptide repeat protein [Marinomonas aquimarina]|uniref:Tetratricopeptide repeat protein n=1 Tax=Marinomonas aquimarina TaxID=295068 RepID=A0A1A8T459_9GAMM|nr:tetratricopeptide repeat protein [Marinomonas aquimarina]SBS25889.1 Tetratricopeptide repeat protein [Marinomonas aquimarina]